MTRGQRRQFTAEQKAQAVRLVREVGSVSQVARDLDLTATSLTSWIRQAEVDAGQGPGGALTTEEKADLARLRRENRTLRMERDFFWKSRRLLRGGRRSAHELIEAQKTRFPVAVMCQVLGLSRSGLYARRQRPAWSRRARRALISSTRSEASTSRAAAPTAARASSSSCAVEGARRVGIEWPGACVPT